MPHSAAVPHRACDANESLESLVDSLVAYHRLPEAAAPHGDPVLPLVRLAQGELAAIRAGLLDEEGRLRLDQLGEWLEQDMVRLGPLLEARRDRLVTSWALAHPDSRLCHEGRTLLANAIGRDTAAPGADLPADPASDLAALLVGLEARGESALTRQALDRYLRLSGDYPQARLLSLFGTCHALSGARRALQRRPAPDQDPEHPARLAESMAECRRYLALAERIAEFRFPPLVIAVGVSGSGKSRFTSGLVSRLGRSGSARMRSGGASMTCPRRWPIHRRRQRHRLWISSAMTPPSGPIATSPVVPAPCWMPASRPAWMPPA